MITEGQVLDIAKEMLFLIIKVSAPLLLISLIVGLIVSIFQTVTSIQEQTLTFVPKIIAVLRPVRSRAAVWWWWIIWGYFDMSRGGHCMNR